MLSLLLFALLLNREWVVKVVLSFRVVWLRLIWIEPFSDLFSLAFAWIGMATSHVSRMYRVHLWWDLHKMFGRDFVPARSTFFARSDTVDFFSLVVFHDQVYKLTLV